MATQSTAEARWRDQNRANVLTRFGVSVTYTTVAGVTSTITAVRLKRSPGDAHRLTEWLVSAAAVAAPVAGDSITDGSDVWEIVNVDEEAGGMIQVACEIAQAYSHRGA